IFDHQATQRKEILQNVSCTPEPEFWTTNLDFQPQSEFTSRMIPSWTILGSGSAGNASFLQTTPTSGVLVDCGLGPRILGDRLRAIGLSWAYVRAVILTHTHGDHWCRASLMQLHRYRIPLFAHARHHEQLDLASLEHPMLAKNQLLRTYDQDRPVELLPALHATPVRVSHDADPTFALRFDGPGFRLGIVSDTGTITPSVIEAFEGVDLLGVEFNHDVQLQQSSRRPSHLIRRVLGDHGHLSNLQAAEFCQRVGGPRLQGIVQLHLSRECNLPSLAAAAAEAIRPHAGCQIWTAKQDQHIGPIPIHPRCAT
ncbi:MAG: MBL fold metallo-hydrolase, partial [Gemmataceae bacterium]